VSHQASLSRNAEATSLLHMRGSSLYPHATVGRGKGGEYTWYDPSGALGHEWGRHLPHWRQPGAVYFVTFRTADSIPADVLEQWRREREAWLAAHPEPHDAQTVREYHARFTNRMEEFLDTGHGLCPMHDRAIRDALVETISHSDGVLYALDWYVIMPNHVHVLVSPSGGGDGDVDTSLSEILHTWKRVSAHRINRLSGRSGTVWQHESWDHLVRSAEHLERYRRYIESNPIGSAKAASA
jgi:REP element-mobilizing transposase RayT